MKKTLIQAGLIVGAVLAVAGLDGAVRGLSMPAKPTNERPAILDTLRQQRDAAASQPQQRATSDAPDAGEATDGFSAYELAELMDFGVAIPVDARSGPEFLTGHIPGAVHLPLEAFGGGMIPPVVMELADMQADFPDLHLVVYCGGEDCRSSEAVGSQLMQFGLDNVVIFMGGYPSWVAAGYELVTDGEVYQ